LHGAEIFTLLLFILLAHSDILLTYKMIGIPDISFPTVQTY